MQPNLPSPPGLGPTGSRKLIEFFGSVEGVLNASLTSFEAAGLPVAAAQSLGTGKSLELARDEIAKADAAAMHLSAAATTDLRSSAGALRPWQRGNTVSP